MVTTVQVSGNNNPFSGGFDLSGTPQSSLSDEISFSINTTATGVYNFTNSSVQLVISEIDLNTDINTTQNFQFTVTNYEAIGTYIHATFSGDYVDSNGVTKSITGTMYVIRAT